MPAAPNATGGPSKSEVRAALARVAASAPFQSSKRLQKLLAFLVEEVLAGRGGSLQFAILKTKAYESSCTEVA